MPLTTPPTVLFVCSGNSCRSPMAAALAHHYFGGAIICNSAAGKLVTVRGTESFQSQKNVSSTAVQTLRNYFGLNTLQGYRPKPIDANLVESASLILFLGATFKANAERIFPSATSKMQFYADYLDLHPTSPTGTIMHEVPDPWDAQFGINYFGPATAYREKAPQSYFLTASAMWHDFTPKLLERFLMLGLINLETASRIKIRYMMPPPKKIAPIGPPPQISRSPGSRPAPGGMRRRK